MVLMKIFKECNLHENLSLKECFGGKLKKNAIFMKS